MLGLIAWILPILGLIGYKKEGNRKWVAQSILSMSACTISLWFQILYNHYLVGIEDWSALMDTTGTLIWISGVLVFVTIILNLINVSIYKNQII